ncbi:MAG: hydrogenase nickel incorporation protein HypB [Roseiflexus sp.]|nr:hydrogenase nickel incorporation protein HypB [Roseiflexus sp.]MDW8144723.1 hydrogenase nickel incorporation protein HypB [Roseiflexaceae bacterium]MDW8233278.1 hydrogenase nickel incorporation protein HypB [Roseiflexaceae bacterium]
MATPRLLEIRQGVLSKNDRLAAELRNRFTAAGIFVVNLLSSPGAGKTRLLEETMRRMRQRNLRVAALVGDLATDNDAQRLARSGAPVRQIQTGDLCHLEAHLIERYLEGWNLNDFDVLFIENVGNLVCPTGYDLGEAARAVLLSVTEGEDKPLKYPGAFVSADCVVVTKVDLAEAVEFDTRTAEANITSVHPGVPILYTSARTGAGLDDWIAWLDARRRAMSAVAEVSSPGYAQD